jgi:hypothetical protein
LAWWGRLGVAGATVVALAACNTSYLSSAYVGVTPQIVTAGCRNSYEVFDKRQGNKLLVVSHIFREYAGCGGGKASGSAEETARARFREAAEHYLTEMRPGECRIVDGTAVSALHHEFTYACSAPDRPAARVALPRG